MVYPTTGNTGTSNDIYQTSRVAQAVVGVNPVGLGALYGVLDSSKGHAGTAARRIAPDEKVSAKAASDGATARRLIRANTFTKSDTDSVARALLRLQANVQSHLDVVERDVLRLGAVSAAHAEGATERDLMRIASAIRDADDPAAALRRLIRQNTYSKADADATVRSIWRAMISVASHIDGVERDVMRFDTESKSATENATPRKLARQDTDSKVATDVDIRNVVRIAAATVQHSDAVVRSIERLVQSFDDHADDGVKSVMRTPDRPKKRHDDAISVVTDPSFGPHLYGGEVVYFQFDADDDDVPSAGLTRDSSHAENHGTKTNITSVAGVYGNAARFNGSSSQISFPRSPETCRRSFTIMFRLKLNADPDVDANNNWRVILPGGAPVYIYLEQNRTLNISVRQGGVDYRYVGTSFSSETLTVGAWARIGFSFDYTTGVMTVVKDGAQTRQGTMNLNSGSGPVTPNLPLDAGSTMWRISNNAGTALPNGNGSLDADMDCFRIIDGIPLTLAEMEDLFANPYEMPSNLRQIVRQAATEKASADEVLRTLLHIGTEIKNHFDNFGPNIVTNGSFEDYPNSPGIPPWWQNGSQATYEREESVVAHGRYAMKVTRTATGGSGSFLSPTLSALVAGKTYLFCAFLQPGGAYNIHVKIRNLTDNNDPFGSIGTSSPGAYSFVRQTFVPVSGKSYRIDGHVDFNGTAGNYGYFDGIFIGALDNPTLRGIVRTQLSAKSHLDAIRRQLSKEQLQAILHADSSERDILRITDSVQVHEDAVERALERFTISSILHVGEAVTSRLPRPSTFIADHDEAPTLRRLARQSTYIAAHADAVRRLLNRTGISSKDAADEVSRAVLHYQTTILNHDEESALREILRVGDIQTKVATDVDLRNLMRITSSAKVHTDALVRAINRTMQEELAHVGEAVTSRFPQPQTFSFAHSDSQALRRLVRQTVSGKTHADSLSRFLIGAKLASASHADGVERDLLRQSTNVQDHDDAVERDILRYGLVSAAHVDGVVRRLVRVLLATESHIEATVLRYLPNPLTVTDEHVEEVSRQLIRQNRYSASHLDTVVRGLLRIILSGTTHADARDRDVLRAAVEMTVRGDGVTERELIRRGEIETKLATDVDVRNIVRFLTSVAVHTDTVARSQTETTQSSIQHADDNVVRAIERIVLSTWDVGDLDAVRQLIRQNTFETDHADAIVRRIARFTSSVKDADDPTVARQLSREDTEVRSADYEASKRTLRAMQNEAAHADVQHDRQLLRALLATKADSDSHTRALDRILSTDKDHLDETARKLLRAYAIEVMVSLDADLRNVVRYTSASLAHADEVRRKTERHGLSADAHTDPTASRQLASQRVSQRLVIEAVERRIMRTLLAQKADLDADVRSITLATLSALAHSDDPATRQLVRSMTPQALQHAADEVMRQIIRMPTVAADHAGAAVRSMLRLGIVAKQAAENAPAKRIMRIASSSKSMSDSVRRQLVRQSLDYLLRLDADFRFYPVYTQSVAQHYDEAQRSLDRFTQSSDAHQDQAVKSVQLRDLQVSKDAEDATARRQLAHEDDPQATSRLDADVRRIVRETIASWMVDDESKLEVMRFSLDAMDAFDEYARAISTAYEATIEDVDLTAFRQIIRNSLDATVSFDEMQRSLAHQETLTKLTTGSVQRAVLRIAEQLAKAHIDANQKSELRFGDATFNHTDPAQVRALMQVSLDQTDKLDESQKALLRLHLAGIEHAETVLRGVMRAEGHTMLHTDESSRALIRILDDVIGHEDAFKAYLLELDPERVKCILRAILFFLPMWEPKAYGAILQDLIDEFESTDGQGLPGDYYRMITDLFYFATQWMPEAYGTLLADLPAALQPDEVD